MLDIHYFMPIKQVVVRQILLTCSTARTIFLKPQEPQITFNFTGHTILLITINHIRNYI